MRLGLGLDFGSTARAGARFHHVFWRQLGVLGLTLGVEEERALSAPVTPRKRRNAPRRYIHMHMQPQYTGLQPRAHGAAASLQHAGLQRTPSPRGSLSAGRPPRAGSAAARCPADRCRAAAGPLRWRAALPPRRWPRLVRYAGSQTSGTQGRRLLRVSGEVTGERRGLRSLKTRGEERWAQAVHTGMHVHVHTHTRLGTVELVRDHREVEISVQACLGSGSGSVSGLSKVCAGSASVSEYVSASVSVSGPGPRPGPGHGVG